MASERGMVRGGGNETERYVDISIYAYVQWLALLNIGL